MSDITELMLSDQVEKWKQSSGGTYPVIVMRANDYTEFSREVKRPDVNGMSFAGIPIFICDEIPDSTIIVMSQIQFRELFPDHFDAMFIDDD